MGKNINALIEKRFRDLEVKKIELLHQEPGQALEKILEAKNPVELVHAFPEEDLYLLVCDIGAADALPVISLASAKQWEYMLDMEVWEGDRLDTHTATKWLDLFLAAAPERLSNWCSGDQLELTELFFHRNIEVIVREEEQDPSELGPDFFTFDDLFYIRVLNLPEENVEEDTPGNENSKEYQKQRNLFFRGLLERLASDNYQSYQNLMMESVSILPAETEEELYRLRNVRLAEKGFLPLEEAIGVYQSIRPGEILHRPVKHMDPASPDELLPPTPLSPGIMLEQDSHFGRVLAAVNNTRMQMMLQSEFAGLCNSIVVADRDTIHNRKDLGGIVKKACGYIGIGLEKLSGKGEELIRLYPLSDIFRVGYGEALELKWQAEKWQKNSWYAATGLRLNFWEEAFMGVVGGLLIPKPLFFDNYASGVVYREFFSADDLKQTRDSLEAVIALDRLFSRLDIDIPPNTEKNTLTYKNVILTLWAAHWLELPAQSQIIAGIPLKMFRSFFSGLWDEHKKPPVISHEMKMSFKDWVISAGQMDETEFSGMFGGIFTGLFKEIEDEYADVSAEDIDPRLVHLFRVNQHPENNRL